MSKRDKKPDFGEGVTYKAVLTLKNGRPVEWVYVVPPALVRSIRRRISRNPNSQSNRLLRALGLIPRSRK